MLIAALEGSSTNRAFRRRPLERQAAAYYTSESSRRLWDEAVPSPARRISFRLSVSTAGFDGEPSPLRDLYDRAMEKGEEIEQDLRRDGNLLCYWTHECRAPWQRPEWIEEMRGTLRPSQFARLIGNQWTSSESTFIELEQWDACIDPNMEPILAKSSYPVWAGLDLGLKHDSTALVAVGWNGQRIRLADHKIFVPAQGATLDIEGTAESAVLSLRSRFALQAVYYDPWQATGLAQRLTRQGVNMVEWPQTVGNLSMMAGNLLDLIKRRQFTAYASDELRQAISKTIAIESSRGWRLGKSKASDRVDPIIALAMAAIAIVHAGKTEPISYTAAPPTRGGRFAETSETNRLYANGRDIAKAEDASAAKLSGQWSSRWKHSGYYMKAKTAFVASVMNADT